MFMPKTVRALLAGTVAVATMLAATPVAAARDIEETEVSAGGCIKYFIRYWDKYDDFMMTIKYHKRDAMQCSIQLTPLDSDFGPSPRLWPRDDWPVTSGKLGKAYENTLYKWELIDDTGKVVNSGTFYS